jgi:glycosyltransferase involved in cell wall biosynthesis
MAHIGFAHQAPLVRGITDKDVVAERAGRLSSFFSDDQHLSVEANMAIFREALAGCCLSLECYPSGPYGETVSDIPLLRAAALGVPSITTRSQAPPGTISARPGEWAETILGVLEDPGRRRGLSLEARAWAETRTTHEPYKAILEEVTAP